MFHEIPQKLLKIKPLEEWIGDDETVSYVAIRADEKNRKGHISSKPNITTRFPFIDDNLEHADILRILDESGIGLPDYYEWRTRSGCYFCFFQRKSEWVGLADKHPDLFKQAVAIEQKVMNDGKSSFEDQAMKERQYSWSPGETLPELLNRRSEIEEKHKKALLKAKSSRKNLPLVDVLSEALDDDDDEKPCTMCHL